MTVDVALSRSVAAAMRPRPKDGDCFSNAFRAIPAAADVLGLDPPVPLYYVEGVAELLPGWWAPHGWVETKDGRVIETTPTWLENPSWQKTRGSAVRVA